MATKIFADQFDDSSFQDEDYNLMTQSLSYTKIEQILLFSEDMPTIILYHKHD